MIPNGLLRYVEGITERGTGESWLSKEARRADSCANTRTAQDMAKSFLPNMRKHTRKRLQFCGHLASAKQKFKGRY